jgi:hypothetical protein
MNHIAVAFYTVRGGREEEQKWGVVWDEPRP